MHAKRAVIAVVETLPPARRIDLRSVDIEEAIGLYKARHGGRLKPGSHARRGLAQFLTHAVGSLPELPVGEQKTAQPFAIVTSEGYPVCIDGLRDGLAPSVAAKVMKKISEFVDEDALDALKDEVEGLYECMERSPIPPGITLQTTTLRKPSKVTWTFTKDLAGGGTLRLRAWSLASRLRKRPAS
jgi:hypothetical protein